MPTRSVPILRKFKPSCRAAARMPVWPTPTSTVIVSKNALGLTLAPAAFSARGQTIGHEMHPLRRWRADPLGPWNTPYIEAMTASNACAVQTLEVAFSLRICCSRVCKDSR